MPVVGAGLGHDIHHRSAGASLFRSVGIGRHAKLLHHFVRKLIRSAIQPARLREERVVEVSAVHEEAVLESAKTPERKIAVGRGSQAAWILRNPGREQHQVGKSPPIERQIGDGSFIDERGNRARPGVDQLRPTGDGDVFLSAGNREVEFELSGGTNIYVQRRSHLR